MTDWMDIFNVYIAGVIQMLAVFYFFTGFLKKKASVVYCIFFAVFGMIILEVFGLDGIWAFLVFILLLAAAGKLLCKGNIGLLVLYAVVATGIMNLCFGVTNSLSYIAFSVLFEKNPRIAGFILMAAGNILALALSVVCYHAIQQCCALNETIKRKYIFMILMPVSLIFLASEYINENIYGNMVNIEKNGAVYGVNPYQMLFMQMLGLASLFCIMSAYKKLVQSFRLNEEMALLEMQANSLAQYVDEAKLRYEKTKAFRHDIKNHMTVVKELLQNKKPESALQYIEGMENLTADISFPISTGHPVLDILLGNKLGIAKESGIDVRCSMVVPYPSEISDMDFCIIFGNALDNAITACNRINNGEQKTGKQKTETQKAETQKAETQKYIHVSGKVQGDFLLVEIENSYSGNRTVRSGTGLANIRTAVEKYHGAMEIRTEGGRFVLSILVIIPQQPESISRQSG